jgi:hypothetical protein
MDIIFLLHNIICVVELIAWTVIALKLPVSYSIHCDLRMLKENSADILC